MNFSDIYNSFNIKPEASVEYTMKLFKKSISAYLNYYFMNYKKPSFFVSGVVTTPAGVSTPLVGNLATLSTFQISTIDENYILNNWRYIQNYFHKVFAKCSMEAHISHCFADIFNQGSNISTFATFND